MARIVDLSMPIEDHFRWPVERAQVGDLAALAQAIAEAMQTAAGIAAEDVYLLFRETPAENHYCGGTPLPNWVPADDGG